MQKSVDHVSGGRGGGEGVEGGNLSLAAWRGLEREGGRCLGEGGTKFHTFLESMTLHLSMLRLPMVTRGS